jgi:hypothetical protein
MNMKDKMNYWICDACGQEIEKVNDGYVIWEWDDQHREHGFQIIHQGKCDDSSKSLSMPLSHFLGDKGTQSLLSMLSIGKAKIELGQKPSEGVKDLDEWVDFFRRVQTPGYEQARRLFSHPEIKEYLHDANETWPYLPENLKAIVEKEKEL